MARARARPATDIVGAIKQAGETGESAWTPLIVLAQALVIVAPAAVLIGAMTYAAYVAS